MPSSSSQRSASSSRTCVGAGLDRQVRERERRVRPRRRVAAGEQDRVADPLPAQLGGLDPRRAAAPERPARPGGAVRAAARARARARCAGSCSSATARIALASPSRRATIAGEPVAPPQAGQRAQRARAALGPARRPLLGEGLVELDRASGQRRVTRARRHPRRRSRSPPPWPARSAAPSTPHATAPADTAAHEATPATSATRAVDLRRQQRRYAPPAPARGRPRDAPPGRRRPHAKRAPLSSVPAVRAAGARSADEARRAPARARLSSNGPGLR